MSIFIFQEAKIPAKRKTSGKLTCYAPAPQENINNRATGFDYSKRSLSNPSIWQSTGRRNKHLESSKKPYSLRRSTSSATLNKKKHVPLSKSHISPPIPVSIPNQKNGKVSLQTSKGDQQGNDSPTHREVKSNMYENHNPKPAKQGSGGCQATSREARLDNEALPGEYFRMEAGEATPKDCDVTRYALISNSILKKVLFKRKILKK